jgi:hypothetical protein
MTTVVVLYTVASMLEVGEGYIVGRQRSSKVMLEPSELSKKELGVFL